MGGLVYTIGHSTHSLQSFLALLKRHNVDAVCDVRTKPYSRVNPQYNRETFAEALKDAGVVYVFLGRELGGRSSEASCYVNGRIQYEKLSATPTFANGLDRLLKGMEKYRIALMCAEKDPLTCHRSILVARRLFERGIDVQHILADGSIENHGNAVGRLLREMGCTEVDMFRSRDQVVEEAYKRRGQVIAFQLDNQPPHEDTEHLKTA